MFAKVYDLLMQDIDYDPFVNFLTQHLNQQQTILDAGCGSGYLYVELLKRKYHVIGIDNDTTMLAVAQEKALNLGLVPTLFDHDLTMPIAIKVDAIMMMFDVANYFKGAKGILNNLIKSLNKGGFLLFDFYKMDVLKDYDNYEEVEEDPINYTWRIKVHNHTLHHSIDAANQTFKMKQYIKPIGYYEKIMKALNCRFEIMDGPDERKHYMKVYK